MAVLALGFVAALSIALLALRAGALSRSGAAAATSAGTISVAAGWDWATLLVAFFVASTLLGRVRADVRARRLEGRIAKGGARDAVQVLANGGAFVAAALGAWILPHPVWQLVGAGGLAASTADTWSTEIGTLASARPRSILTAKPVEVGTSGGVTAVGLAAGVAGAAFIAVLAVALRWPPRTAAAALVGGIAGALLDSVLGASLQARRWCDQCDMVTEQTIHRCGAPTRIIGGQRWLNNDGVNAISTLFGAAAGAILV